METGRYTEEENKTKKGFGKKKDGKTDKKDKGYIIFEEENSEEEVLVSKDNRTPLKLKKHSKPSFKFAKKPKEKEKEKEDKRKDDKEKKKEEKIKSKKKKFGNMGSMGSINTEPADSPVFGVQLEVAVQRNRSHDGILLPAIFRECVDYIEEYGLTYEGIYRISGVKSKVQALKEAYNKQIPVYLKEYDPSVVASLLKQFLRELPEPVLTTELTPKFEQASTLKNVKQKVEEYQRLIEKLPECNRCLLSWTIVHMTHVIAREKQNKMSLQNVSIVLSPTMQISHRVLNVLFTYSKILFRDTGIKKYIPPLKPVTSRWSLDLPDSPNSLEDELKKQESLLDELHKELMKVKDTDKEEQLWEVQRVVTGLKRKLKLMKKAEEHPGRSPKLHKPLPPSSLDLKRKHKVEINQTKEENLDVSLPTEKENNKTEISNDKKIKPISTPSKQMTELDLGDIEQDSSAKSQRNRRSDSPDFIEANKEEDPISTEKIAKEPVEGSKVPIEHTDDDDDDEEENDDDNNEDHDNADNKDQKTDIESKDEVQSDDSKEVKDTTELNKESTSKAENKEKNVDYQKVPDSDPILEASDHKNDESETVTGEVVEVVCEKEMDSGNKNSNILEESTDAVDQDEKATDLKNEPPTVLEPEHNENVTDTQENLKEDEVDLEVHSNERKDEHGVDERVITEEVQHNKEESMLTLAIKGLTEVTGEKKSAGPAEMNMGGIEPEKLAAALNELVHESEEDINQRVMSEFVQDFGIEKTESLEQDEEYIMLLQEQQALLLEEEELRAIGDELRQKIETEQNESERLREEILEIQVMREDLYSSDYNSSSDSSSDDDSVDGDGDLETVLSKLFQENECLEIKNRDLCDKIHQERQICLEVKVEIRMLQAKQLESSINTQLDLLL